TSEPIATVAPTSEPIATVAPTSEPIATVPPTSEPTATVPPTSEPIATVPPTSEPIATVPPTPQPFLPAQVMPSRILAPAINLDSSVVEMGWQVKSDSNGNQYSEWVVPEFAAGWHKNSLLPGHGGNTVLSAHNNTAGEIFRDLADIEPGHTIQLQADGISYSYVVEEKYIVKEEGEPIEVRRENNRFIEPTADERLTLVSCWPYQTNSHRVIVIARPVLE
ncbi:MAG: sortase domain-bontaining protein, partial [Ardenticatenaceae bacterium]